MVQSIWLDEFVRDLFMEMLLLATASWLLCLWLGARAVDRPSGTHFNPAKSDRMMTSKRISFSFPAQILISPVFKHSGWG